MTATTPPGSSVSTDARRASALRAQFEGWVLVRTTTIVVLLVGGTLILAGGGLSDETARAVIRLTARVAVVLFCAAFAASSMRVFWRSHATAWLLAQRRYVGVSAAATHGIHMVAIAAAAWLDPQHFFVDEGRTLANSAVALGAVVAFALMAATSFDGAVRMLGRRNWYALHWVCGYYVLIAFLGGFAPRLAESPVYALPVAFTSMTWALRIAARIRIWIRRRR